MNKLFILIGILAMLLFVAGCSNGSDTIVQDTDGNDIQSSSEPNINSTVDESVQNDFISEDENVEIGDMI